MKLTIKEITFLAGLTAILFVQEQFFTFLPNVQLTVLLLVVYSKTLGMGKTIIILMCHIILDSLAYGGFTLMYTPFMFLGWLFIPVLLGTVFKRVESEIKLALISVLFSLLYSWIFIIPSVLIFKMPFWAYLIADIPFEIILAVSSFTTVLLLYKPIKKIIMKFRNGELN